MKATEEEKILNAMKKMMKTNFQEVVEIKCCRKTKSRGGRRPGPTREEGSKRRQYQCGSTDVADARGDVCGQYMSDHEDREHECRNATEAYGNVDSKK